MARGLPLPDGNGRVWKETLSDESETWLVYPVTMKRPTFHRPSLRLKAHDYAQPGTYFVTLVTWQRVCLFGSICGGNACVAATTPSVDDVVDLNEYGEIARRCWTQIPDHFPSVELDVFVVMPNHVHGLVVINTPVAATHADPTHHVEATHALPLPAGPKPGPKRGSVAAIVGSYKSVVSRRMNAARGMPGLPVWQSDYYEHIVRNERALSRIREYIQNNPARWAEDAENPERTMANPTRDGE